MIFKVHTNLSADQSMQLEALFARCFSERNDVAGVVLADYDGDPIASQLPDSMDVSTISKSAQSAFLHLQEAITEIQRERLQQITASCEGMLLEILETGSGILIVARESEPLLDFSTSKN